MYTCLLRHNLAGCQQGITSKLHPHLTIPFQDCNKQLVHAYLLAKVCVGSRPDGNLAGKIRISKPLARHKFAYPSYADSGPASCTNLLSRPYQRRLLRGSRRSALVCFTNDKLAADFVVAVIYIRACAAWHSPQPCVSRAIAHCCDVHRFKGLSNRQPLNICQDRLSQGLIDESTASKPLQQLLRQA